MVREYLLALVALALGGCSALLDWSDEQIPKDAYDLPYTPDQCTLLEPNDTLETAAVYPGATVAGAICKQTPPDHDFYKLNVPADGATVTVALAFPESTTGDLDVRLYDATGSQLAVSREVTQSETITCPSATCPQLVTGDYVVEVYPALDTNFNAYMLDITSTGP